VSVKPDRTFIGVHVESVLRKARDWRFRKAAAKGQDKAVIGQNVRVAAALVSDRSPRGVDICNLRRDMFYPDWIQQMRERDPRLVEVGLIISNADGMPAATVDNHDLDLLRTNLKLVKLASSPYSTPKTAETGAKDKYALQVRTSNSVAAPILANVEFLLIKYRNVLGNVIYLLFRFYMVPENF
jgi:hypothetical protein